MKFEIKKENPSKILNSSEQPAIPESYAANINTDEAVREIKGCLGAVYVDFMKKAKRGVKGLYASAANDFKKEYDKIFPVIYADIQKAAKSVRNAMAKPIYIGSGMITAGLIAIAAAIATHGGCGLEKKVDNVKIVEAAKESKELKAGRDYNCGNTTNTNCNNVTINPYDPKTDELGSEF